MVQHHLAGLKATSWVWAGVLCLEVAGAVIFVLPFLLVSEQLIVLKINFLAVWTGTWVMS